jgi:acetolactate synthase-1/2/3 large subunit
MSEKAVMSQKTEISGAGVVLEKLIEKGVTTVFGYPGGAVIPLYHEWVNYKSELEHYRTSDEQHAVHAADGYARATGKVGVCFVTSGPGATNTVTGIATAFMDSIPMVIISGQVPSHLIGKDAFQEVDITSMTVAITKHNFLVHSAESLESVLEKAFEIACEGRPGPVLVDIPKDFLIQKMPKNFSRALMRQNTSELSMPEDVTLDHKYVEVEEANKLVEPLSEDEQQLIQWISESERPLIYCGGGVKLSHGETALLALAEQMDCPVIHSLMGLGCISRKHRLSIGMAGMHGCRTANEAINKCDLLLAIGVRFSDRVIGNPETFDIAAKIVHIDLDPMEHHKNLKVELTISADAKKILSKINPFIKKKTRNEWLDSLEKIAFDNPEESGVDWIFNCINEEDDGNTVYATDVGQHQMWSAQKLCIQNSRNWISSGGLGTMGFGLGAAIGAKIGMPEKSVMLITGDGSFGMNFQELITLMDYELKVDIVLFDNRSLGMVKQWQTLFQNQIYAETQISGKIDYESLAKAFGLKAYKAIDAFGLKEALKSSKLEKRSTMTIVSVSDHEHVFPIVPPGRGLEKALYK